MIEGEKVDHLMQQTNKNTILDLIDADLVLPIAHWGSKMN